MKVILLEVQAGSNFFSNNFAIKHLLQVNNSHTRIETMLVVLVSFLLTLSRYLKRLHNIFCKIAMLLEEKLDRAYTFRRNNLRESGGISVYPLFHLRSLLNMPHEISVSLNSSHISRSSDFKKNTRQQF